MKKTLAIVLALALALSMFASMAFVLSPGSGSIGRTNSQMSVTGFFVTNDAAMIAGANVYTDLVDNTETAYAKNEVIRIALTFDILNPIYNAGVQAFKPGDTVAVNFTSDTVDLSLSQAAGMIALRKPLDNAILNATQTVVSTAAQKGYKQYVAAKNQLFVDFTMYANGTPSGVSVISSNGIGVGTSFARSTQQKASFAYIFSGITKGEITEEGAVKANMNLNAEYAFADNGFLMRTVNGRTYLIKKIVDNGTGIVNHQTINKEATIEADGYYDMDLVAYRVFLVGAQKTDGTYDITPIAQLDTESIVYSNRYAAAGIAGEQVEGLGYSLGIEKIGGYTKTSLTAAEYENVATLPVANLTADNAETVFTTVLYGNTVRYVLANGTDAFDAEQLARLNTMLSDFGLGTGSNYNYKLEDKAFAAVDQYLNILTAEYNNGIVTPVEGDDEDDIQEGTPDDELPEDDEIIEDGDIVEDDVIEDEVIEDDVEVPVTGDASASIAVALAAAAIVAAAALAFVMKKVRD